MFFFNRLSKVIFFVFSIWSCTDNLVQWILNNSTELCSIFWNSNRPILTLGQFCCTPLDGPRSTVWTKRRNHLKKEETPHNQPLMSLIKGGNPPQKVKTLGGLSTSTNSVVRIFAQFRQHRHQTWVLELTTTAKKSLHVQKIQLSRPVDKKAFCWSSLLLSFT